MTDHILLECPLCLARYSTRWEFRMHVVSCRNHPPVPHDSPAGDAVVPGLANDSQGTPSRENSSALVDRSAAETLLKEMRAMAREWGLEADKLVYEKTRSRDERAYCDGKAMGLRFCEGQLVNSLGRIRALLTSVSPVNDKEKKAP